MKYRRDHSGLILAVRMTFAHFSVSSAMNLAKSAAEPPNAMPQSSASRAFVVGSASAALIPWLSLSIISAGVVLGRPTPCHELASYPGTKFAHARHFRKPFPSRSGRHSERTQLVTSDV